VAQEIQYGDGVNNSIENSECLLHNLMLLVAVSKGVLAVKLYSNTRQHVLIFVTGVELADDTSALPVLIY